MIPAISVEHVTKVFNDFKAVDDISFQVKTGEIYGFLGPNGSGKSTTLRMIMSLMNPSNGHISLFGKSLQHERAAIMKEVGCIIEKPDFYNYLSAKDNLALFARANLLRYTQKNYDDLFELVGLKGREKEKVKNYSHGMKQRLGIAQALIHNPSLIILDEPNTGLDPQGIIDLRNLIFKLNKEQGKTILFSSHILTEVQAICNSMVVINRGKVLVEGNVETLLSTENLSVKLEVSNPEKCLLRLRASDWNKKLVQQDGKLFEFKMGKEQIPTLIHFLSEEGIDIERIDHRNQLEDYFLKITHN